MTKAFLINEMNYESLYKRFSSSIKKKSMKYSVRAGLNLERLKEGNWLACFPKGWGVSPIDWIERAAGLISRFFDLFLNFFFYTWVERDNLDDTMQRRSLEPQNY